MEAASETEKKLVFIPKPSPPEKIVDAIDLLVCEEDTKGDLRQVNTVTAKLSVARCDFATAQTGSYFFIAGGFDGTNCVDTIDVFNLDSNTGTVADISDHDNIKLSVGRRNLTAITNQLGKSILFMGDENTKEHLDNDAVTKIKIAPEGIELTNYEERSSIEKEPEFQPMFNGPGTNGLFQTKKTLVRDESAGVITTTGEDYRIFIEKYENLLGGFKNSTYKLLDACTMVLTAQNHYRGKREIKPAVRIPIEEYMKTCGISNTKPSKDKLRRQLQKDLEFLYCVSIEWKERRRNNTKDYGKMRIVTAQGIKNGNIILEFAPHFAKYLTHAYVMQFPISLLKLDERNPSAYKLGRKLALHASIDNNKKRGTNNIISVRYLLKSCPEIPSYEEVVSGHREVNRRIIEPFKDALDALDFVKWEFSNSKGTSLTEEQLKKLTYGTFFSLLIARSYIVSPSVLG
jgi:hypothetical protein